ncbi:MAG: hypothetical protein KAQ93_04130 [Spirochaetales bacterium]|nr:hypothetical protein [Spirochaetales bacterium]
MHFKKKIYRIILLFSILILIFNSQSCTLKQTLNINKDASGDINFELTLAPFFVEVAEQLSELFPEGNDISDSSHGIFDIAKIREDFSKSSGSILEKLENPSSNILQGTLLFDDIRTALNGSGSNNILEIFSFTTIDNINTVLVEINYETVEQFLLANPSMNSPLMESFGPLANRGLNNEDYLDMMQFALGDESRVGIKESYLIIDIKVDGKIISQSGGIKVDQDTVRFKIPLLRILLLDEPESFSVSFSE